MNLKSIFTNNIPLIDVRAPVEFQTGTFPNSHSLPILNDEERRVIGTCYKQKGKEAAVTLGYEMVSGENKENKISKWMDFKKNNPNAILYCFRGGLRSQISQKWLKEKGVEIDIIPGGYKKCRQFMIDTIIEESSRRNFLILGGKTGSGKTELLKTFKSRFLDLEKHANHKGSSFGGLGEQPSQVSFENRIGVDLLNLQSHKNTLVESESVMIGRVHVPKVLYEKMIQSSWGVLERSLEERVTRVINEYVIKSDHSLDFMLDGLNRIEKKLGSLRYFGIKKELIQAYESSDKNKIETHMSWVEPLLKYYYDPYYEQSLKKNEHKILFRGDEKACLEWLHQKV